MRIREEFNTRPNRVRPTQLMGAWKKEQKRRRLTGTQLGERKKG